MDSLEVANGTSQNKYFPQTCIVWLTQVFGALLIFVCVFKTGPTSKSQKISQINQTFDYFFLKISKDLASPGPNSIRQV